MKILILPIAIVAVFIIAASAIVIKTKNTAFITENKITQEASQPQKTQNPEGQLVVTADYKIKLIVPPENIAALAVRLTFNNNDQFDDPSIKINSDLLESNWMFPVKKVYRDQGKTIVDLAAVNVSTTGYPVNNELTIATLDFPSEKPNNTQLIFDPQQTKVIKKDGTEILLGL
jgi:hypothetical protein